MARPKGDNNQHKSRRRVYIAPECYARLKIFSARYGAGLQEAIDTIVYDVINENGDLYPEKLGADKNTVDELMKLCSKFDMPVDELLQWMVLTIQVLFSDELRFCDVIKPIPELQKLIIP